MTSFYRLLFHLESIGTPFSFHYQKLYLSNGMVWLRLCIYMIPPLFFFIPQRGRHYLQKSFGHGRGVFDIHRGLKHVTARDSILLGNNVRRRHRRYENLFSFCIAICYGKVLLNYTKCCFFSFICLGRGSDWDHEMWCYDQILQAITCGNIATQCH